MSELISKAVTYKLVIFYVMLFSINALCSAMMLSFMNTDWDQISSTSKFLVIVGVLQNWTGVLLAFFNKSLAKIEKGEFPISNGDTTVTTQTATKTDITTTK